MSALPTLINGAGTWTVYGAGRAHDTVAPAMAGALGAALDVSVLMDRASAAIAETFGTEAGHVVSCGAGGITVAVAACIAGTDLALVHALPDPPGPRPVVVMQAAHDCDFGAPVSQMVRLAGAAVRSIGTVNATDPCHLAAALETRPVAVLHVVSYEAAQSDRLLALPGVARQCREAGVPLILDLAGQHDIRSFLAQGGDLAITSAQKHLGGPTAGIIAGRADLVAACRAQLVGIGRPMKPSKESLAGVIAALDAWRAGGREAYAARCDAVLRQLARAVAAVPGLSARRATHPPPIQGEVLRITVDRARHGHDARTLLAALAQATPRIVLAQDGAQPDTLVVSPAVLTEAEADAIGVALASLSTRKEIA